MCLYTLKHFCLRHTPEFLNDKKVSVEKVKYFHSISKKKKYLHSIFGMKILERVLSKLHLLPLSFVTFKNSGAHIQMEVKQNKTSLLTIIPLFKIRSKSVRFLLVSFMI